MVENRPILTVLTHLILIAGRPNFFFDEEERVASLGIRDPNSPLSM